MWNPGTVFLFQKLNTLSSHVPSPPNRGEGYVQRKVLVLHCHPDPASFSVAISNSVVNGLVQGGHEVKLRRMYYMGKAEECYNGRSFNPCLSEAERGDYYDPSNIKHRQSNQLSKVSSLAAEVREAIEDLRWCNAIVFVFPTWWFNFPAALKGYFDRVITPGVGFLLPDSNSSGGTSSTTAGGTGLIGCLTNITKIGVVTTSGASWAVTQYAGRGPRHFVARGFRTLCAPDCQVTWHQLYETASRTERERRQFLQDVQAAYAEF